jgi:predicted peptidase
MTQADSNRQHARTFQPPAGGPVLPYLLYLPPELGDDPAKRWPLILFLHGAGERGSNLDLVKVHGIPHEIEAGRHLPCVVVSPQCPAEARWDTDTLITLLDAIEHELPIDTDRRYVTGMSMGGYATWALALNQPDHFAAIAPICGGGNPATVCTIKHLPVWAFHGALDDVVPLRRSEEIVDALRACGGDVQFTVYHDLEHDSWTPTYANPELYNWLLAQARTKPRQ